MTSLKRSKVKFKKDLFEILDEETTIDFMVTDAVWAKAKVPKGNRKVNLWLGANIMIEYTFEEARALLTKNLENANTNLAVFVSEF